MYSLLFLVNNHQDEELLENGKLRCVIYSINYLKQYILSCLVGKRRDVIKDILIKVFNEE
ncbi:hypothetical protein fsci_19150 [Francisella sciaenopsi]|uniref:Uncharacterized protein n=1 Tax=Francisella sciaenopsi TaxID=3055034 RepID=A0ABQ6PHI3_9GAMM